MSEYPIPPDLFLFHRQLQNKMIKQNHFENILQDSEEKYRYIFEKASVSLWEEDFSELRLAIDDLKSQGVTDFRKYLEEKPEFIIQAAQMIKVKDVNEATLKLYGAKNKDELLESLDKVFAQESFSVFEKEIIAIAEGKTHFESEAINQTLQGNRLYILMKVNFPSEKEKFSNALVSIVDITERKLAEKALKRSEKSYRTLAQNLSAIVYRIYLRENYRMQFFNDMLQPMTGYTAEELIPVVEAGSIVNLILPEDRAKTIITLKHAVEHNQPFEIEYRLRHKEGGIRYFIERARPILGKDGDPLYIDGIIIDISEQKHAERKIRDLAKFPSENPNPVLRVSKGGEILYANKASLSFLGEFKTGIGKFMPNHIRQLIKKAFDSRQNRVEEWKLKDRVYSFVIGPVIDEGYVDLYGRDTTLQKKLEKQLHQNRKMEALGTLAGGIAHDFNNILGAIIAYTELSMDDISKGSPTYENLREIIKAGNRAASLIKQILTFSRKDEKEKKPVQISAIIKEGLKMMRATLPSTIKIHQNMTRNKSIVKANPTQIHQILINLFTNAAQAMGDKGGVLKVGLVDVNLGSKTNTLYPGMQPGVYVKLSVEDTGYGIKPEVIDRIFDPFFTTKEQNEGTGMGLSVVHGIVESHGGKISVSSKPGRGTIFTIFFPKIEGGVISSPEKPKLLPSKSRCILFVDDERPLVYTSQKMLMSFGYEIIAKTSSLEALNIFRTQPDIFDLVITDQTMPNMTGIDLAKELMTIRPDIPIIICTGYNEKITKKNIRKLGIREVIMKPFDKYKLHKTIQTVLKESV